MTSVSHPTPPAIAVFAGGASAALLAAALFFQAIGYAPCELCLLQRWPHAAAVAIGLGVAVAGFRRILGLLGLLAEIGRAHV